jgi:urease gamma subunit
VAELLDAPLQVEAAFGDGSRLVVLEGLVAG